MVCLHYIFFLSITNSICFDSLLLDMIWYDMILFSRSFKVRSSRIDVGGQTYEIVVGGIEMKGMSNKSHFAFLITPSSIFPFHSSIHKFGKEWVSLQRRMNLTRQHLFFLSSSSLIISDPWTIHHLYSIRQIITMYISELSSLLFYLPRALLSQWRIGNFNTQYKWSPMYIYRYERNHSWRRDFIPGLIHFSYLSVLGLKLGLGDSSTKSIKNRPTQDLNLEPRDS